MPTVLVTGSAGFIGSAAVRRFSSDGWRVVAVDAVAQRQVSNGRVATASLPDPAFDALIREERPDLLVHCAGSASVPQSFVDVRGDFERNVSLTFYALEAIRVNAPACRFILLSSAAVYGNPERLPVSETCGAEPISPYGFHKLQAEQLVREFAVLHQVRGAALRVFSAYGPGLQRQVLWDICRKAMAGTTLRLQGTGEESRDFVHVDDVVEAIAAVAERAPLRGEVYNVANGVEHRIADVARRLVSRISPTTRLDFDGSMPAGTPRRWCADTSRITALGFRPRWSVETGLPEYADWFSSIAAGAPGVR